MKILIIHGPNLNLLGVREPEVYGSVTMEEINQGLEKRATSHNIDFEAFQSNAEHEIVTKLQDSMNQIDFIIINPGALTHTSIAIRDSLLGIGVPFYEIHISNIYAREDYRRKSITSEAVNGVICGFGENGYVLAIDAIKNLIYSEIA